MLHLPMRWLLAAAHFASTAAVFAGHVLDVSAPVAIAVEAAAAAAVTASCDHHFLIDASPAAATWPQQHPPAPPNVVSTCEYHSNEQPNRSCR